MVNAFIEFDEQDFGRGDFAKKNAKVLLPLDNITVRNSKTNGSIVKTPQGHVFIKQDFETVKAMITGAGFKVIETQATPTADKTLRVGEKKQSTLERYMSGPEARREMWMQQIEKNNKGQAATKTSVHWVAAKMSQSALSM